MWKVNNHTSLNVITHTALSKQGGKHRFYRCACLPLNYYLTLCAAVRRVKLWEQHFLGLAVAHFHDVHPALRPAVATAVDGVVAHNGGLFLIGRSHGDSAM